MDAPEMRNLIERFLAAYNSFDLDGMLELVHPDIEFQNIASGQVSASASGKDEFRGLAEFAKGLFSARNQKITGFCVKDDVAVVDVEFTGTLAHDLPNGLKKGHRLCIKGKSEYAFYDGKIRGITDRS